MSHRLAWYACLILVALALCLPGAAQQVRVDSRDAARSLFAGADYEDALGMLDRLSDAPRPAMVTLRDIDALRATCLLALGRDDDARDAMVAVVELDPRFAYPEADVAPRIRSTFLAPWTERLPDVVRSATPPPATRSQPRTMQRPPRRSRPWSACSTTRCLLAGHRRRSSPT